MRRIIEVIVSPHGETHVETKGFTGAACQQASRFIEQALGNRQSETLTSEFYQAAGQQNRIQEGR